MFTFVCYLPETIFLLNLLVLLLFLTIQDFSNEYKFNLVYFATVSSVWNFILIILLFFNSTGNFLLFWDFLVVTDFLISIKSILFIFSIPLIILSYKYLINNNLYSYEYFILIQLSIFGLCTLISSNDLITFYLAVEIQSLCFYVLAAIKLYSNFATEAALKYFILGAISSGLLLLGCSFIYGSLGTSNFDELAYLNKFIFTLVSKNEYLYYYDTEAWIYHDWYFYFWDMTLIKNVQLTSLLVGLIFILVSILFKLGAAPYHMWLPDVYEGVPTILTAFFAIIPKLAMFVLFVNFSLMVFGPNFLILKNLILLSIFFSLLIGITGALYQSKFKRLLAYSAIAHIGFLLLGYSSLTNFGLFALFFYLIAYMLMSLNVFTILLTLRKINNNLALKKINEITLLFKSNPLLAVSFAVVLFSVAGIPPLLGFYSKLFVFIAAIFSNLYNIVIVAALLSVVASLYYIRLIKLLFFKNFDFWYFFSNVSKFNATLISVLSLINLLFFCFPQFIILFLYKVTWVLIY